MNQTDRIIETLESNGEMCDDCLSDITKIRPRQSINQKCRKLESQKRVSRLKRECPRCDSVKVTNQLASNSALTRANSTLRPMRPTPKKPKPITEDNNFQRVGSISNAHVGRAFEEQAKKVLHDCGIEVEINYLAPVGVGDLKKDHAFDLGNNDVLVECKSHRWTTGGNVPSAKITIWNEAMLYFQSAPSRYRKIFFILRDERASTGETLAEYYLRNYRHLVPKGVEFWEFCNDDDTLVTHKE